jgi:maleamate amidohydrolase
MWSKRRRRSWAILWATVNGMSKSSIAGQPFESYLSPEDKIVLETYGHGNGLGVNKSSRPAILVIDATYMFVGEVREAVSEAVKRRRNACGNRAWNAIDKLQGLLAAARAKRLPIVYTAGGDRPDLGKFGGATIKKALKHRNNGLRNFRRDNEIVDEIAPHEGDIVIQKQKPSAFFSTPLLSYLVAMKVDSLYVTGGATSGCVRGSVVDAFSNNYACTIVSDCCFDRFEASHTMSLFDLGSKYAEIFRAEDVIRQIESLPDHLFSPLS